MLMLVEGVGPKKRRISVAAMVRVTDPYQVLRDSSGRSGKGLKELAVVLENLSKSDDLTPDRAAVNQVYVLPCRRFSKTTMMTIPMDSRPRSFAYDCRKLPRPNGISGGLGAGSAGWRVRSGWSRLDRTTKQVVLSTIHSIKAWSGNACFCCGSWTGSFRRCFSFNTDEGIWKSGGALCRGHAGEALSVSDLSDQCL